MPSRHILLFSPVAEPALCVQGNDNLAEDLAGPLPSFQTLAPENRPGASHTLLLVSLRAHGLCRLGGCLGWTRVIGTRGGGPDQARCIAVLSTCLPGAGSRAGAA